MAAAETGHRVGAYLVGDLIGEGGMGSVYAGTDPRFDRPVAVKVLHPQLHRNPEVVERFKAEAVIQAKLNHPSIVSVLDFVADEQHLAIVMEFVEGVPLDRLIAARGALATDLAVTLFSQVLSGIGFAHSRGLVHRDLKPSNVLVQTLDGGEVLAKIADFGIAKILGTEKLRTATSAKMGTLAYMSPEHLRSPKNVDARSDLYSIGVALFEALTGRVPFDADSEYELMRQIVEAPVPPARSLNGSLPPAFDALVARATAKDPEHRFQTAAEFKDALRVAGVVPPVAARRVPCHPTPPAPALGADAGVRHEARGDDVSLGPRPLPTILPWVIVVSLAGAVAGVVLWLAAPLDDAGPRAASRRGAAVLPGPGGSPPPTKRAPAPTPTPPVVPPSPRREVERDMRQPPSTSTPPPAPVRHESPSFGSDPRPAPTHPFVTTPAAQDTVPWTTVSEEGRLWQQGLGLLQEAERERLGGRYMEARLTLQAYRALEERSAQASVFVPLSGRCQTTEQNLERDIATHCLITMESGRADPTSIRPGKTTRITLVYTVLTAGSASLTLGRGITYAGKNVATFDSEVLTMADGGTREVTFPVNMPARAPGGHYEVVLRLSRNEPVCDGRAVTLGVPFRVK